MQLHSSGKLQGMCALLTQTCNAFYNGHINIALTPLFRFFCVYIYSQTNTIMQLNSSVKLQGMCGLITQCCIPTDMLDILDISILHNISYRKIYTIDVRSIKTVNIK